MSDIFLWPFQSLYSKYAHYQESKAIHAVISNPETKVARHAIDAAKADRSAAKAIYDKEVARVKKYENAVNLIKDGKKIDGYLKIFSAIEASSTNTTVTVNGNQTTALHRKLLKDLDREILDKKGKDSSKTLREELNDVLKSKVPVEKQPADLVEKPPIVQDEESDDFEETVTQEKVQKPLIKKIKESLPSQKNKREAVEEFTEKVAELEAACFGFAARYCLFGHQGYDPIQSLHKPEAGDDLTPLERYSLLSVYEEAVVFLRKISPHYYNRQFHIIPSAEGKKINNVANNALGSSSPKSASQTLQSTPSKVPSSLLKSFPSTATLTTTPSSASSSTKIAQNTTASDLSSLDEDMHTFLKSNGVEYADENTNDCPLFEDVKKLVLYYKQQNSLMRHEEIPLVGGTTFIQDQTQARIDISLYDYHIILKLLTEQKTYGPLITNLIDSHKDLLKTLSIDEHGKLHIQAEPQSDKKKINKKPPALDPWMSGFVKYVLRNRVPLNLYVLFPDLTQALEKCFIGKRIGSAIGIKLNEVKEDDDGNAQIPILLTDDEDLIRCTKANGNNNKYQVEFKINNQWFDITTEKDRNKSIKGLLETNADGAAYGSTLTKDITFNEALKQFRVRSVGWHHLDIIHGTGLQIYHKHYHVTKEIAESDKKADGALKDLKKYNFKTFKTDHKNFEQNNYLFTRTREQAALDAVNDGAHEGDLINRDHFTSQLTSFEDIQQQYPDYDLSKLEEGQFGIFYSANREDLGLSIEKTHAFIKMIIPEGNNRYRILNMGYFPDNDLANMFQIASYLGKTERGALQGDEGHFHTQRDRVGLCMVLDNAEFTKTCNYLQKQFNKTRQDRLSFQPFGTNCAHRLTKIFRNTQADSFHTALRTNLETAYKDKLKPVHIFDRLWKVFSRYILRITDEYRMESFRKTLRKAIDRDDMNTINSYLSDLLPRLDQNNSKALFDATADFLAKVHLNNQSKFDALNKQKFATSTEKYGALLDSVTAAAKLGEDTKEILDPYKQLTPEHNQAFFNSVSDTMDKYKTLVDKQTSKEALNKELKDLLKQFIVQGLKTSSPYGMSIYDLEGDVSYIVGPLKYVPFEFLRNFIFACLCAFPLFGLRWRNVQKYDAAGNCTNATKRKSLFFDFMRVNRFKLPAQIFNTVRRNDEFIVTEMMLAKQMRILQSRITALPVKKA